jgi:hypothetical protein
LAPEYKKLVFLASSFSHSHHYLDTGNRSAPLHMLTIDTTLFMLKDKLEANIAPAFTAVNA